MHKTNLEEIATKRDIDGLIRELKRDMKDLDAKIDTKSAELEYRMTIRFGLMMMAVAGMLFTALRFFPPLRG